MLMVSKTDDTFLKNQDHESLSERYGKFRDIETDLFVRTDI
jgi:hypothetical protein